LIRFRANLTDQAMANLLNSLVSANVPVAQFHEVQTDLEDAFLTVTKEDRAKMV
jgi:ABC-2 type transport system ATP-binding protein